jgi:hypothetical protein
LPFRALGRIGLVCAVTAEAFWFAFAHSVGGAGASRENAFGRMLSRVVISRALGTADAPVACVHSVTKILAFVAKNANLTFPERLKYRAFLLGNDRRVCEFTGKVTVFVGARVEPHFGQLVGAGVALHKEFVRTAPGHWEGEGDSVEDSVVPEDLVLNAGRVDNVLRAVAVEECQEFKLEPGPLKVGSDSRVHPQANADVRFEFMECDFVELRVEFKDEIAAGCPQQGETV